MECLANYQQMVDPTMVWGTIKSDDAVRMDVSFTWKKEEWLIPAVFPIPGGLVVDVARKAQECRVSFAAGTADAGPVRPLSFSS